MTSKPCPRCGSTLECDCASPATKTTDGGFAEASEALVENEDFYYNEEGFFVFTEKYHLKKGYCCQNGCKHCPYGFNKK